MTMTMTLLVTLALVFLALIGLHHGVAAINQDVTCGIITSATFSGGKLMRMIDRRLAQSRSRESLRPPLGRSRSGMSFRASVTTVDGVDSDNSGAGNVWIREFYNFDAKRSDAIPRHSSDQPQSQSQSYNISYHYRPASPGHEHHLPPILFIHPVGIGLASWFWEGLYTAYASSPDTASGGEGDRQGHPSLYAVNLMGCGVTTEENSALMDSSSTNDAETVPLLWVDQCERLLELIRRRHSSFVQQQQQQQPTRVSVVAQGGLAPIAIQLASRNPDTVHSLILTSPPPWSELTTAIPKASLDFNFRFLQGPLGPLAFSLLETRWAVEFFSNLFLFGSQNTPCDSMWLDRALEEAGSAVRPPVQVFNAGYCQSQSYERELRELEQPTLVLHGQDDLRRRSDFVQFMRRCQVVELPGKNVLPWESPREVASAVHLFLRQQQQQQQQSATTL